MERETVEPHVKKKKEKKKALWWWAKVQNIPHHQLCNDANRSQLHCAGGEGLPEDLLIIHNVNVGLFGNAARRSQTSLKAQSQRRTAVVQVQFFRQSLTALL